jgi:O-succinylbenzoate synthase
MALLDAELRAAGKSLASVLGAHRRVIPAGANLSLGPPDEVVAAAGAVVQLGYRRVKCKIAPGRDVTIVRAVRAAFPDLVLSVDANGAYDLERADDVAALRALDEYGLAVLEQPLRADDLLGHARLQAELATTVVLDESIPSFGALEMALALKACGGVSVKLARLGGIGAARRVHDRCVEAGVQLTIGGMLETGIGRAAAIALGAMNGFELPGDLGASDRYFVPDLTAPHLLVAGDLAVPSGPGLGVELDEAAIAAGRVRSQHFSRP